MLNSPSAAGTAIIKMLMTAGAKDIIAVDQFGTLYRAATAPRPTRTGWAGDQSPSGQGPSLKRWKVPTLIRQRFKCNIPDH